MGCGIKHDTIISLNGMSNHDSEAIEDRAVNEVIRYFEDSKIVGTYITNNDKGPFFDNLFKKDDFSEQINFVSTIERYVRKHG